jgi:hypothetical protein
MCVPWETLVCPCTPVLGISMKANDHPPPITSHTYIRSRVMLVSRGHAHTCILHNFIGLCLCYCLVCAQVLVLEHLSGGEMLRQLQRLKRYSEANACQMFKQVRMHGGQGVATAPATLISTNCMCSGRAYVASGISILYKQRLECCCAPVAPGILSAASQPQQRHIGCTSCVAEPSCLCSAGTSCN